MLSAVLIFAAYLLYALYCLFDYTVFHLVEDLQVTSFSQILFNMNAGEGGGDAWNAAIQGFFDAHGKGLIFCGFLTIAGIILCLHFWRQKKAETEENRPSYSTHAAMRAIRIGSLALLVATAFLTSARAAIGLNQVGFYRWVADQNTESTFYKDYYVNPKDTGIVFNQKKNLIYIFLESMETSYSDKADGGFYNENLIPNLTRMSKMNNSFGDGQTINGAQVPMNAGWTTAAILAQTSGSPMIYIEPHGKVNGKQSDWTPQDKFLPELVTMGDILEENGYKNYFACGSNSYFGGRHNYFAQNGNYTVYDFMYLRDNGYLPENEEEYRNDWGNYDKYLLENCKQFITEAAQSDEPFNFTLLTVDTHFPNGYICSECKEEHETSMKNVISCSDRQVYQFVKWIQAQPFYKDTVVVVAGDHLSMSTELGQEIKGYDRKTYFTILNGPEYTGPKREFSTLDIFPTVLSAVGARIEGNRLGLGANLYSAEPTLVESMGIAELNNQIPLGNEYFIEEVLKSDVNNAGIVHE